jgi:membrane peptidoglycan carboxypeptidase
MIQAPNRLTPLRHEEALRERRDWVLGRMVELGWASAERAERLRGRPIRPRPRSPEARGARRFVGWVAERVEDALPGRLEKGRGVVVETGLDAWLQRRVERAVETHLDRLRERAPRLARRPLSAAAVVLDARDGRVLSLVGGDPGAPGDAFDRARRARRPIGSTVKPLVLLEAFEDCGDAPALHAATRVADTPVEVRLEGDRTWRPANYDGRHRGVVTVRRALRASLNVPFVRVARHCGFEAIGAQLRELGLDAASPAPPAVALGAVESSPLDLAVAYTVFGTKGRRLAPRPILRVERPSGGRLLAGRRDSERVVHASTAFVVERLLQDAVERGTGRAAAIPGATVAGKTGTSSGLRDAWFAGRAEGVIVAVWVGLDAAAPLGLTGAQAAAPLWREVARHALAVRPALVLDRPFNVVTRRIDPDTGLEISWLSFEEGREELFRRVVQAPRDGLFRRDEPAPVLR